MALRQTRNPVQWQMRSIVLLVVLAALAVAPAAAETAPSTEAVAPATAPASADPAPSEAATAPTDAAALGEAALRALVRRQAISADMPPEIAEAVADVESSFNPRAVGGVGEVGLMQVLPSTARMLGFSEALPRLFEPEVNVRYGVRYLSEAWRKTGNDLCATVMKYRAGHGETRYSQKSVAYCVRVRELLAARGFKVTGTVPTATFGFGGPMASGKIRVGRRLANGRVRMSFNWRTVDAKRRNLDKEASFGLRIAE